MRIVTFKLEESLLNRLDERAFKEGRTRSEVIRDAIIRYLGNTLPPKKIRVRHIVLT